MAAPRVTMSGHRPLGRAVHQTRDCRKEVHESRGCLRRGLVHWRDVAGPGASDHELPSGKPHLGGKPCATHQLGNVPLATSLYDSQCSLCKGTTALGCFA